MIRHDNIYFNNLSYNALYKSYLKCSNSKHYRTDVINYYLKFEYYITNTLNGLKTLKYEFGKYKLFYVLEPKKRRILSASFSDRIVHTWLVNYILAPIFIPIFISTSYACIKLKGMHKCSKDVQKYMRVMSNKYNSYYILKFDIAKYFDNIDKRILFSIISNKIKDKNVLWLVDNILNSSNEYYENIYVGIPIGNLTSQMFANIYLNELDKYIKNTLKCKYYFRYMDDGVILLKNKSQAKYVLKCITIFLRDRLSLELNKKTNIFRNKQGINFCGYYITEKGMRIRKKGKEKLKKKLKLIEYLIKKRKINIVEAKKYIVGHIGYICHADVNNLVDKYF